MNRNIKKMILTTLIASSFTMNTCPVYASELSDLKTKLNNAQDKVQNATSECSKAEKVLTDIDNAIKELDIKLTTAKNDLSDKQDADMVLVNMQDQESSMRTRLDVLTNEVNGLQASIDSLELQLENDEAIKTKAINDIEVAKVKKIMQNHRWNKS